MIKIKLWIFATLITLVHILLTQFFGLGHRTAAICWITPLAFAIFQAKRIEIPFIKRGYARYYKLCQPSRTLTLDASLMREVGDGLWILWFWQASERGSSLLDLNQKLPVVSLGLAEPSVRLSITDGRSVVMFAKYEISSSGPLLNPKTGELNVPHLIIILRTWWRNCLAAYSARGEGSGNDNLPMDDFIFRAGQEGLRIIQVAGRHEETGVV